jgi:hypothetical protein
LQDTYNVFKCPAAARCRSSNSYERNIKYKISLKVSIAKLVNTSIVDCSFEILIGIYVLNRFKLMHYLFLNISSALFYYFRCLTMVNFDFCMICKIAFKFYLLELLCVSNLEFILHKCNVNTFKTLDPFNMRHGILGEKHSSHSNGELFWIFLVNALWRNVCWNELNFKILFDFLCFNLGNFDNELEDDFDNVHEEKTITISIDLMDGCTIICIQDIRVSLTSDPLYHSRG